MREDASGRITPALGERCLISARKRGRGRFCLEMEEEIEERESCLEGEDERAAAKRTPPGPSSGKIAPAAVRARAPVSAVNSPNAIRRLLAARISPSIEP